MPVRESVQFSWLWVLVIAAYPLQADIATKKLLEKESPIKKPPEQEPRGGAAVVAKLDGGSEVGYDILIERAGVYGLEAQCPRLLMFADLVDDLHENFTSAYLCRVGNAAHVVRQRTTLRVNNSALCNGLHTRG